MILKKKTLNTTFKTLFDIRNLEKAEHRVGKLERELKRVDGKVADLRKKFEKRTTEAATLKIDVDKANKTIERAETLVEKLSGERERWSMQVRH